MHKEAIQSSQQGFYQNIDNVVPQFCFSREISFIRDGLTYEGWRLTWKYCYTIALLHISSTIIVDCPGMLSQRDDSPLVGFTRPQGQGQHCCTYPGHRGRSRPRETIMTFYYTQQQFVAIALLAPQ